MISYVYSNHTKSHYLDIYGVHMNNLFEQDSITNSYKPTEDTEKWLIANTRGDYMCYRWISVTGMRIRFKYKDDALKFKMVFT